MSAAAGALSAAGPDAAAGALVVFTPSGRRGRFATGTSVLSAARALGVDIDSVCGGHGLCGRCQVEQAVGEFPRHAITSAPGNLSPPGPSEAAYRASRGMAPQRRLGCLATITGDAVIDVPPESQVHRQVVRKELSLRPFPLDPVIRLHYLELERPSLGSPASELSRLLDALREQWGLVDVDADVTFLRALQLAVEQGDRRVTVAVGEGRELVGVWPGLRETVHGVAVDVGSTTLAGYLAELGSGRVLASDGMMNPQIRFGEDLMSRVSHAMLEPGGAASMTRLVRRAISELVGRLVAAAGLAREDVLALTIVGNPIMHHLMLGLDPVPLGSAPFTLATDRAVRTSAAELGIAAHPGARVYVLPCIAGHVGADTAGAILAEAPGEAPGTCLLVDVGTNAEIVLSGPGFMLAASSPTGPAFEGAQVSAGQRAAPGAIERVRIDRATLEPRFRVVGADAWSDEADFAAATAAGGVTGICGSGIVEAVAELFLAGVIGHAGAIDGSLATRSARIVPEGRTFAYLLHEGPPRLLVSQSDVRAIQLAKAAAYAGARLLMDQAGISEVDEIRLAGAFGSRIDPLHAMVLGLIPDCDPERVRAVGNAAGSGALMALLSKASRTEIEALVRGVRKIETATEPRFGEHFVAAMALPHASAEWPNLRRVVELPPRPEMAGGDDRPAAGRTRRRSRGTAGQGTAGQGTATRGTAAGGRPLGGSQPVEHADTHPEET